MSQLKISTLVEQVLALKKDSEVNLLEVDQTLIAGRTALKNSATQQYLETFAVLKSIIGNHAGGIFVRGAGATKFAELAAVEAPALVLDASEVYRKVAEHWYPTVRVDKVFAIDCVMPLLGGLNQLLSPLGIREIARPDFGNHFGRPVNTLEDATEVTRSLLRGTVGDDLNGLYLNHRLTEEVVKAEWDLNVVPVVILNTSEAEVSARDGLAAGLFYGRNIAVMVDENVGKKEVGAALRRLRAMIRGEPLPLNESTTSENFDNPKHETAE